MRTVAAALLLLAVAVGCRERDPFVPAPGFGAADIEVSDGEQAVGLEVEVAADATARYTGLMFRQELKDGRGMLFIYPTPTDGGHWMNNTYVPLDIAYADDAGTIFAVVQGRPLDTAILPAGAPFTYVLEVPEGWFARNGLRVGSHLVLPADLPTAE